MLEASNIHKVYRNGAEELPVLKGISLKIEAGRVIGIVGPSGAGKSTLLHILGGLDAPTQGAVLFEGSDIYRMPERHLAKVRNRHIGFVFQFYHLFPEFNVLENVLLPSLCGPVKVDKKKFKEKAAALLKSVGLEQRYYHLPGQLSGGEQQRVAVARALINEPKILFCDEPTGNLDSATGREVMDMIRKLNHEQNMTVVLVTHNEDLAKTCDAVLHLKDGLLVN